MRGRTRWVCELTGHGSWLREAGLRLQRQHVMRTCVLDFERFLDLPPKQMAFTHLPKIAQVMTSCNTNTVRRGAGIVASSNQAASMRTGTISVEPLAHDRSRAVPYAFVPPVHRCAGYLDHLPFLCFCWLFTGPLKKIFAP